jgi:hypothetical protein
MQANKNKLPCRSYGRTCPTWKAMIQRGGWQTAPCSVHETCTVRHECYVWLSHSYFYSSGFTHIPHLEVKVVGSNSAPLLPCTRSTILQVQCKYSYSTGVKSTDCYGASSSSTVVTRKFWNIFFQHICSTSNR